MIGTETYLAPEVLAGEPATVRSDLYALGVVLAQAAAASGADAGLWALIDAPALGRPRAPARATRATRSRRSTSSRAEAS